ncbi:hypothetical protein CY34DRAFT_19636 [Suillus luteus UH-Slu-Lm8-n1]|uniref:Uncharacterized protein n=1 Tax=Suillus luteus UH-Slu-Lm8-n1 TaxID=930992 RepID=A0A0C9Z2N5_9AGAM|nr:hypothetical protein CY34DRAFT_19636 [Suillus luteus UH-Slu-Lm8-n1]
MSKLNAYHERSPMYMDRLRKDLWMELGESCRYLTRQQEGDSDSELDFDAMEEYARSTGTGTATHSATTSAIM